MVLGEMRTSTQSQLEQLFESRYHGATNIGGIRFQLAYSVLCAFDLYGPDAPDTVQLEGIEDVDVNNVTSRGLQEADQYIQVKTSKRAWTWSRFAASEIIERFMPVWSANPAAQLLIVTNFGYKDKTDYIYGTKINPVKKILAKRIAKKEIAKMIKDR